MSRRDKGTGPPKERLHTTPEATGNARTTEAGEGRSVQPRADRPRLAVQPQLVSAIVRRRIPVLHDAAEVDLLDLFARSRLVRFWPVIDEQRRLLGLVSRADLLAQVMAGTAGRRRVAQIMAADPHRISADATLERAAGAMRDKKTQWLLVVDDAGRLEGLVTDDDLLSALTREMAGLGAEALAVDHLMTREPLTVEADDLVDQAAGLMLEHGIRHLPVIDSERKVVGIISERDLRARLGAEEREWVHATQEALDDVVGNVMTPDPVVLRSGTELSRAIETFMTERIGAIPILDEDDRLVGILSHVDLLRWLRAHLVATRPQAEAGAEPLQPSQ